MTGVTMTWLFVCLLAFSQASSVENQFASWMKRHNKVYTTEDLSTRFAIWKENLAFIEEHNANAVSEGRTYTVALNHLADMTSDEYRSLLGVRPQLRESKSNERVLRGDNRHFNLPASWDWRTKGAVLPVQNQGQCGSCYAFTALDAVTGLWFRTTSLLMELSVQEALDCATQNDGCNGGFPTNVYAWIMQNKGICLWADYPYNALNNNCAAANCTNVATITGSVSVAQGDENALQAAVYSTVVASAINASLQSFQFYSSGVYNDPACNNQLDHGMTNIGWGVDPKAGPYWILRNMWGQNWGMNGYILMARGKDMCGVADAASFPTFQASN